MTALNWARGHRGMFGSPHFLINREPFRGGDCQNRVFIHFAA